MQIKARGVWNRDQVKAGLRGYLLRSFQKRQQLSDPFSVSF